MSAGRMLGALVRCRAGDPTGCGQHPKVFHRATLPQRAASRRSYTAPRCRAVPTAVSATSASWCLGQAASPEILFLETGDALVLALPPPRAAGRCCCQPNTCSSARLSAC